MDKFLNSNRKPVGTASLKRPREDDWKSHVNIVEEHGGGSYTVVCNHCQMGADGGKPWKTNATRILGHLRGTGNGVRACKQIPDKLREILRGNGAAAKQAVLPNSGKAISKDAADAAVAECFYFNGMAFNIAESEAFKKMCVAIGQVGPGYEPPSRRKLAGSLLDQAHESVRQRNELWCNTAQYARNAQDYRSPVMACAKLH